MASTKLRTLLDIIARPRSSALRKTHGGYPRLGQSNAEFSCAAESPVRSPHSNRISTIQRRTFGVNCNEML